MVFADSVNIARRLSSKHENDLLQENILGKIQVLSHMTWINFGVYFSILNSQS